MRVTLQDSKNRASGKPGAVQDEPDHDHRHPDDEAGDRENPQSLLLRHSNPPETKGKIPLYLTLQYSM